MLFSWLSQTPVSHRRLCHWNRAVKVGAVSSICCVQPGTAGLGGRDLGVQVWLLLVIETCEVGDEPFWKSEGTVLLLRPYLTVCGKEVCMVSLWCAEQTWGNQWNILEKNEIKPEELTRRGAPDRAEGKEKSGTFLCVMRSHTSLTHANAMHRLVTQN